MMFRSFPDVMRYHIPNSSTYGDPFHVRHSVLLNIGMPPPSFIHLTNQTVRQFVFGTSASANHFEESLDAIGSVQRYFPEKKIIYVDLGLGSEQAERVSQILRNKVGFDIMIRVDTYDVYTK